MPHNNNEEQIAYVQRLMASVTSTLESTRMELEQLLPEDGSHLDVDIAEGTKTATRLKSLVTTLSSLETSIVKLRINQTGAVDGCTPLDLEQSRLEIGRRLARLRAAAGTRNISE